MNRIGLMLGRLSPPILNRIQSFPIETWKKEFTLIKSCGFNLIEWVFDDLQPNPIMNDEGIFEIKSNLRDNEISINSVCADYFMINKLFNVSTNDLIKNLNILSTLIQNCNKLDISILELPFVDSSSLQTQNDLNQIFDNLNKILDEAEKNQVQITLEADLPPHDFKNLLEKFDHPCIKANYDIGNSVSNGYDPKIEFEAYSDFVINIHIKDRIINGPTVPLGKGDVDFNSFFSTLSHFNYKGDLIIQAAREDLQEFKIEPEKTCKKYLYFVRQYIGNTNKESQRS